jgi:hypothetical protein
VFFELPALVVKRSSGSVSRPFAIVAGFWQSESLSCAFVVCVVN